MLKNNDENIQALPDLSTRTFLHFQKLMQKMAGIFLSDAKLTLVANRLAKRVRALRLADYQDYFEYITEGEGFSNGELQQSINLLTTHETYFFREPAQFDFLREQVLPKFRDGKPLRMWSAACSTGEEPYSLGMVVADILGLAMDWTIFATDIAKDVLEVARAGIYDHERIKGVSKQCHRRFLMKGVRSQTGYYRVIPELRRHIKFAHYNLIESPRPKELFDVILCRNVLIYFDRDTKQRVVDRLCVNLKTGGYFLAGQAESMLMIKTQLRSISPSTFQKQDL